jgi:hypothetical protein
VSCLHRGPVADDSQYSLFSVQAMYSPHLQGKPLEPIEAAKVVRYAATTQDLGSPRSHFSRSATKTPVADKGRGEGVGAHGRRAIPAFSGHER